ncbi:DMT family transporter [Pseudonocardia halophobica]|uniref:Membrane protein n=1 Tax=Pseudonocardia halophobica TaxID=29401 RepID=A0A9W6P074_9PSEU|nr:DMT family transporter [Pseudonocardia halophobica]GLL15439.1 membrane protein [Pseudonocardia halophobica]
MHEPAQDVPATGSDLPATEPAATAAAPATTAAGPRWGALAAVCVTVLAWASAFVGIRFVGRAYDPGALALGRLAVGTLALGALLLLRGRWVRPTGREWALLVLCGVAWFAVYNVALNAAEQRVDAGTTAMLVNIGPILIALFAGVLLREGFPRWLLIGAGVAFAGAVVIGASTAGGDGSDLLGIVLCVVAAVTYAIGVLAQKPVLRRLPALQVTFVACAIGTAGCLPFAGALGRDLTTAPWSSTAGLVYLGLVPTALAFSTWAYALARMDAGRLGVTTYLVPPITVALSALLLGEAPPALALLGGALCLAGVGLTRRR